MSYAKPDEPTRDDGFAAASSWCAAMNRRHYDVAPIISPIETLDERPAEVEPSPRNLP